MKKIYKMLNKKSKGFTLIELIVVIAILAILAMLAIPSLAGFSEKAKQANDKEAAAIVANGGAMYYASNPDMAAADMTTANLQTAGLIKAADLTLKSKAFSAGGFTLVLDKTAGTVTVTLTSADATVPNYTLVK